MLKKTITFLDFNEQSVTEDFYFNFTKAELAEMELGKQGGMQAYLERILELNDAPSIIAEFKHIILGAVGKRSEDGRRFIKTQEIREDFEQTEAYSELFMELLTKPDAVPAFIGALMPKGYGDQVQGLSPEKTDIKILPAPEPKPWITEDREPTKDELQNMSKEDMVEAMIRKGKRKMENNEGFSD